MLQRAVPEVANALGTTRSAILSQGERHAESAQNELARIYELLRGITTGDVPLRIHVTAGFGPLRDHPHAAPAASSAPGYTELQNVPPSQTSLPAAFASPVAPYTSPYTAAANAAAAGAPAEQPPSYKLLKLKTVNDVWREWRYGIGGNPAVEALEAKWGHQWRSLPRINVPFCRRKAIWDEILRLLKRGVTEEAAVAQLENLRGNNSINKLQEVLKERHGGGAGTGKKRKRTADAAG